MNKSNMIDPKIFDFKEILNHFNYDMIEIITSTGLGNGKLFATCNYHKHEKITRNGNLNQTAHKLVSSGILQDSNIDTVVFDDTKPHQKRITLYYYLSYGDFLALEKTYNDKYLLTA